MDLNPLLESILILERASVHLFKDLKFSDLLIIIFFFNKRRCPKENDKKNFNLRLFVLKIDSLDREHFKFKNDGIDIVQCNTN